MKEEGDISLATQEKMADRASRQSAAMEPEQQKDALNMGTDLFTGRLAIFFQQTAEQKAIPVKELCVLVSPYRKEGDTKYKVRYDIMRLTSNGSEPAIYGQHVLQFKIYQLLGLPEILTYVIKRKLQQAILESLKVLSGAEKLPVDDLALHISHDLKLALFHKKAFHKTLELQQIIQKL